MYDFIHWHISYFNYWLTHCFYFAAGLIIIVAIASNKMEDYKRKILATKGGVESWALNQ